MENQLLLDSKRIFVKFISHEIRTPINTVTLGLQLLSNRLSDLLVSDSVQQNCECGGSFDESTSKQLDYEMRLTEAVEECLDLVHDLSESSSTAVLVLNDLINYDKVQLKRFHIEKRLCNVYDVLKRTVQPQELLAKAQRVMLISPNFDGSAFLIGDEVKLGQVIR
jgi:signal transduction histidine kinase